MRRRRLTPLPVMLLSIAALAQEQIAVGAVVFGVLFLLLVEAPDMRSALRSLWKTIPIWAASLIIILAPGNFARAGADAASYGGGIAARMQANSILLADKLFAPGHDKNYFVYIMMMAMLLLAVHAARKRLAPVAWLTASMAGVAVGLAVLYQAGHIVPYTLLLVTAFTAMLAIVVLRQRSGHCVLAVHLAGIAMLAPLLLAPAVAPRSALPFFVLEIVPVVYAFTLMRGALERTIQVVLVALIGVKAVSNAAYIYNGFRANAEVLEINDHRLHAAALPQNNRMDPVRTVELFKVPRPRFAEKMPYDKPVIGEWMKKYYGLDEHIVLTWREFDGSGAYLDNDITE